MTESSTAEVIGAVGGIVTAAAGLGGVFLAMWIQKRHEDARKEDKILADHDDLAKDLRAKYTLLFHKLTVITQMSIDIGNDWDTYYMRWADIYREETDPGRRVQRLYTDGDLMAIKRWIDQDLPGPTKRLGEELREVGIALTDVLLTERSVFRRDTVFLLAEQTRRLLIGHKILAALLHHYPMAEIGVRAQNAAPPSGPRLPCAGWRCRARARLSARSRRGHWAC